MAPATVKPKITSRGFETLTVKALARELADTMKLLRCLEVHTGVGEEWLGVLGASALYDAGPGGGPWYRTLEWMGINHRREGLGVETWLSRPSGH